MIWYKRYASLFHQVSWYRQYQRYPQRSVSAYRQKCDIGPSLLTTTIILIDLTIFCESVLLGIRWVALKKSTGQGPTKFKIWMGASSLKLQVNCGHLVNVIIWHYIDRKFVILLSGKGSVNHARLRIAYCPSVRVSVSCTTFHVYRDLSSDLSKAVSLLYTFLLNHHKLLGSIIVFARHCWPLGLFISFATS